MVIKGITDECFSDYKEPAMLVVFPYCTFKCDKENGCQMCQNSRLVREPDIEIDKDELIRRYLDNTITKAIVCGGLEPFDSIVELNAFIDCLRRQYHCNDTVIIYTGYTEEEIVNGNYGLPGSNVKVMQTLALDLLTQHNLIVKYGRFRPNQESHFDKILGVRLASPNQYAKQYD